jgi:hypothetical protein
MLAASAVLPIDQHGKGCTEGRTASNLDTDLEARPYQRT